MGRSSKFIASEVRLRSPSWKAWAFVLIALCPAFVGVDTASAGPVTVSVPITVPKVNVPTVSVPRLNVPTVSVPKIDVPKVNVPTVNVPTVYAPTATISPSGLDRTLKGGPWMRNIYKKETRTAEGRSPFLEAKPSHGGAAAGANVGDGGSRIHPAALRECTQSNGVASRCRIAMPTHPYPMDSNTVCGRYPYPACH